MSKYCSNCQKPVDDELVVCPDCKGPLNGQIFSPIILSNEQLDHIVDTAVQKTTKKMWKRLWGGFAVIAVGSFVFSWWNLETIHKKSVDYFADKLNTRIETEFESERIKTTVTQVAKGESKELILTTIKPEINVFKEQTNEKVEKFDEFIKNLEKKYQDQYVVLEKEVQKLKLRNEINKLKERAMLRDGAPALQLLAKISHGNFDSKIPIENEKEKESIKLMAKAMVNSVVDYYINVTFLRNHTLVYKDDKGIELKNVDISTDALIDYLSKDNFKDRALAARLLGSRKEIKVAEALLDRIYNDSDVEVLKEANKSFYKLTGEYRGDIPVWPLTEYYKVYWKENKEKIREKFKKE